MPTATSNPAFVAYGAMTTVLCVKLWILWALTGSVRAKTKTTPNAEDASTVSKGAKLVKEDPDAVARAMRVYYNAAANEVPFLVLGLVYVMLGAASNAAWILFGVFTGARILHAITYSAGKQPWRTISFVVGQLAAAGLAVQVVRALAAAA